MAETPSTHDGPTRSAFSAFWSGRYRTPLLAAFAALAAAVVAIVCRNSRALGPSPKKDNASDVAVGAMPYLNYHRVKDEFRGKVNTTIYDKERAYRGYNLYSQKPDTAAILIDMDGEIVHRWSSPRDEDDETFNGEARWGKLKMMPNGDLLYHNMDSLSKIDWNSHLIWRAEFSAHHDFVVKEDGSILSLYSVPRSVELGGKQRTISDDGVILRFGRRRARTTHLALRRDDARQPAQEDARGGSRATLREVRRNGSRQIRRLDRRTWQTAPSARGQANQEADDGRLRWDAGARRPAFAAHDAELTR